jgi:hypothetical protein
MPRPRRCSSMARSRSLQILFGECSDPQKLQSRVGPLASKAAALTASALLNPNTPQPPLVRRCHETNARAGCRPSQQRAAPRTPLASPHLGGLIKTEACSAKICAPISCGSCSYRRESCDRPPPSTITSGSIMLTACASPRASRSTCVESVARAAPSPALARAAISTLQDSRLSLWRGRQPCRGLKPKSQGTLCVRTNIVGPDIPPAWPREAGCDPIPLLCHSVHQAVFRRPQFRRHILSPE